ncbi:UNVERIFIED_CONTAM: hypothetical protein RMT77_017188 [Armadillidium vulgare]
MGENSYRGKNRSATSHAWDDELFYKDFRPSAIPSRSSCCGKGFTTFSEIVEVVNNWLRKKERIEVINCEVILVNSFPADNVAIKETWPNTRYIRGLRVWWKNDTSESSHSDAVTKKRFLLGFRDFLPNVDRKSLFKGQFETAHEIILKVNSYIASKTTPVKVISLQTLDVPYDGFVDINADTDENQIEISQHGYTRFVRVLRLYFLTQYPKQPRIHSAVRILPQLEIKDFMSKPEDREGVPSILSRAMSWCSHEENVALLNVQILDSRSGSIDTANSIWTLESPGHIPNKFSTFVRVVFVSKTIKKLGRASSVMNSYTNAQKEKSDDIKLDNNIKENANIRKESANNRKESANNRKESARSRSKQFAVTPIHEEHNETIKSAINHVINDAVNEVNGDVINGKERPESATSQSSSQLIVVQPTDEENKNTCNNVSKNNGRESATSRSSSKMIVVKSTNDNIINQNEENMDVININDKSNNIACNHEMNGEANHEPIDEKNMMQDAGATSFSNDDLDDEGDEALSIITDYDANRSRYLISKSFYPMLISEGGLLSEAQYESTDVVVNKINSWISAVKGVPIQIQTQFQYFKGDYPDMSLSQWVQYLPGGSWLPVFHVIIGPKGL